MILESIVTTIDESGVVNVAPMGPVVDPGLTRFTLRPFKPSRTYDNLLATRRAVIHVTDDPLLFARSVTGGLDPPPPMHSILDGRWWVLSNACRYFAVEIAHWRNDPVRAEAECHVVASGNLRPFFGFNRAKHAVIEAAILATRVQRIDHETIRDDLQRLRVLVEKTAGPEEREAFAILTSWITRRIQLNINRATEK